MTTTNHTSPSGEDDFVFKNHQRLLFLTADLEDADLRKARNDLLDRMPVMTYSAVCLQIDAILSERSLSLNPLGSSKARPISDVMMDLVDRLGHEWKDVDPRAWSRLLIYAPNGEDAANGAMGEREACNAAYAKQAANRRTDENDFGAGWEYAIEWMQARSSLTAEKVAAQPVAWFYYEDDEFIRMCDSEEKALAACDKFGGDWLAVYTHAAPQQPEQSDVKADLAAQEAGFANFQSALNWIAAHASQATETTYTSSQATNCAVCGEHKHTPLRIDWMGGYVCLTCIDKELEARDPAVSLDDERAAFEAWAKTKNMDLTPFDTTFDSDFTSNAWDGWQARAASPQATAPQPAQSPDGRVIDKAMVKRLAVQHGLLPVQTERALTDEHLSDLQEAREILENMVRSVELDGNYSTEATCTFLRQALLCLPAAQPASGVDRE